jgi:hypothetical protein
MVITVKMSDTYIHKCLLQDRKGRLELVNNLNEEWKRMRTGEQYFILYKLDFPVRSPLPTVKSIIVNNQVICKGNKPSKCTEMVMFTPHQYVTLRGLLRGSQGEHANGKTLGKIDYSHCMGGIFSVVSIFRILIFKNLHITDSRVVAGIKE